MEQQFENSSEQAALYLQHVGIRPFTKAYQYLLFALTQLQQNTPFQNTLWELTAIYFGQTQENVLACVRREISRAFRMVPAHFSDESGIVPVRPPKSTEFLRLGLYMINRSACSLFHA